MSTWLILRALRFIILSMELRYYNPEILSARNTLVTDIDSEMKDQLEKVHPSLRPIPEDQKNYYMG